MILDWINEWMNEHNEWIDLLDKTVGESLVKGKRPRVNLQYWKEDKIWDCGYASARDERIEFCKYIKLKQE